MSCRNRLSLYLRFLLASCFTITLTKAPVHSNETPPPRFIATFSILADWVKNVAGEKATVISLIGPNGDLHQFEPTPSVLQAVRDADVIFKIGLGLEPWLDSVLRSSGSKAHVVEVSVGVPVLSAGFCRHSGKCTHAQEEFDPHIWQNPRHAIHCVKRIRDTLVKLFPQHTEVYRHNSKLYIRALEELDRELAEMFAKISPHKRKLVTNHHSMGYFAQRYGFQVVANILSSPSTEASDPPPGEIARISHLVREQEVPAIFSENISGNRLAALVAREAGVPLITGLHTCALGSKPPTDTYIGMMRYNASIILNGLLR